MITFTDFFNRAIDAKVQRRRWETAIFVAGIKWGMELQRTIDQNKPVITGLPPDEDIIRQAEQILKEGNNGHS